MSMDQQKSAEGLLLSTFRDVPFHSLYFFFNVKPKSLKFGGTCSDKVLHAKKVFEADGYNVRLHSSFIKGKECHRLIRLEIDDQIYFADVGNAWPAIKLFPAHREIRFTSYGIEYFTKLNAKQLAIYQRRGDETFESTVVPFQSKPEADIYADIDARFQDTYPFTGRIRFAQIINDKFLFLRDTDLYTYSDEGITIQHGLSTETIAWTLRKFFGFDVNVILNGAQV